LIAINSPNNIDPLLQTGCFSSVVSSSTNTIAPAPHGPGLLRHDIDQPEIRRKIEQLTIFSDSQTAIGILTLHWKIENHKRITLEILYKIGPLLLFSHLVSL
jgi:hypothetical protein